MSGDGLFGGFTDQIVAEILRDAPCEPFDGAIISQPVSMDRIRALLPANPPPRITLHCHPSVTADPTADGSAS